MNIILGKPYAISERGNRVNNEDAIYPLPEQLLTDQKLFMVCDGVGGAEKGEVASALACESIQTYFSSFLEGNPSTSFIHRAVHYTETRFDDYIQEHPEAVGMATTLTLAYTSSKGVVLAHIGDSRIYYIRKGEILYQSEDHSLVNSLVKVGKITPEEARNHPKKNVILRAIQGSHTPTEADIVVWKDVHPGDCIFLCTDGVLENLDDQTLASLFNGKSSILEIKDAIMDICDKKTKDNFSFYLIPIEKVQINTGLKQNLHAFLYSFM